MGHALPLGELKENPVNTLDAAIFASADLHIIKTNILIKFQHALKLKMRPP